MKKPATFQDLDQRRKRVVLADSHALAVALELVAKKYGHNVARSIKIQGLMAFRQKSDLEVDESIADLDHAINTKENATGVYQTPKNSVNNQNWNLAHYL